MGSLRSPQLVLVALFWFANAPWVVAQPGAVTTNPSPPTANQPFTVSVTALVPGAFAIDPQVETHGNVIVVFLRGECFFVCPPNVVQTLQFTAPPLPSGSYVMTVYSGYSAVAAEVLGTTTLTIAAQAVPTLTPLSLLILIWLLSAIARANLQSKWRRN